MSDQVRKLADFKAMAATVRQSIKALEIERDSHQSKVDSLNLQIAQLELVLNSLAPLVDDVRLELEEQLFVEGVSDVKLTEAVRQVMKAGYPGFRTARGIRDTLNWSGYDLGQHNNPLASIYGVLKRLVEAGEVEEAEINEVTRYRWKSEKTRQSSDSKKLLEWAAERQKAKAQKTD